jgi:adenylate cyclase class 2
MKAGVSIEREVKLRIASPQAGRELLLGAGAALVGIRELEDNAVYDDAALTLRGGGATLRLRRTPSGATFTYKGPRLMVEGVKTREEQETSVGDPGALDATLQALGYRVVFRYEKYRETWSLGGAEVVVDETPIGCFLEIEGEVATIHGVASSLGFSPRDYLADSYVALFFASGGRGNMTFPRS